MPDGHYQQTFRSVFVKTFIISMVACLVLVACNKPAALIEEVQANLQTISGTVVFRERIGLTQDSKMEIILLDVSDSNTPGVEIVKTGFNNPGQSPIAFAFEYDADLIDEQHDYGVVVNVFDRGKLILVSENIKPVLTGGAGSEIRVNVVRASQTGQ